MSLREPPEDAAARRAVAPVRCYPDDALKRPNLTALRAARRGWEKIGETLVPPRAARCFTVPAGAFARILCDAGPQVGDLNLWSAQNPEERFFSGKTRALHGAHVSTGDRLWSCLPFLRPMATITEDTLCWYGIDEHGCAVHDVIGTRCDPYANRLLKEADYHHCCHSNLTRAVAQARGLPRREAEAMVHDVLNVFMCTGFDRSTGAYMMKATPARRGDFIEFFAEIELFCALSACPGGDCGAEHSSDAAICHPLLAQVFRPPAPPRGWRAPAVNAYRWPGG